MPARWFLALLSCVMLAASTSAQAAARDALEEAEELVKSVGPPLGRISLAEFLQTKSRLLGQWNQNGEYGSLVLSEGGSAELFYHYGGKATGTWRPIGPTSMTASLEMKQWSWDRRSLDRVHHIQCEGTLEGDSLKAAFRVTVKDKYSRSPITKQWSSTMRRE